MTRNTVKTICDEYGITAEDVRVAAAVQVTLNDDTDKSEPLDAAIAKAEQLLNTRQFTNAIRWALYVKHAREYGLPGKNFDELMDVRKVENDAKENKETVTRIG